MNLIMNIIDGVLMTYGVELVKESFYRLLRRVAPDFDPRYLRQIVMKAHVFVFPMGEDTIIWNGSGSSYSAIFTNKILR